MKKIVAAAVASVFALGSLATFAAGMDHRAPVHQVVVKKHKVKKTAFHNVKHTKKKHAKRHVKRTHRAA